jgi:3-deoxy-D-manno-octulosonate 8-phosphate phosphatase (KDO 8-P phosphatase)
VAGEDDGRIQTHPIKVPPEVLAKAKAVRGIVFDVDGVLTDGRVIYTDDGHELKQFHVQDGASLKLLQANGISVAIVTGRRSPIVARRARELGIEHVVQGSRDKAAALDSLIAEGFPDSANAAVGDDIQDLKMFTHTSVGLPITVPNAHPAMRAHALWTTQRIGGDGVVVDIAQLLLQAQNKWQW